MLREGAHIPAESEVRKVLTPDAWCAYEAMQAGLARLAAAGLQAVDRLEAVPPEKLAVAAESLRTDKVGCALALGSGVETFRWGTLRDLDWLEAFAPEELAVGGDRVAAHGQGGVRTLALGWRYATLYWGRCIAASCMREPTVQELRMVAAVVLCTSEVSEFEICLDVESFVFRCAGTPGIMSAPAI